MEALLFVFAIVLRPEFSFFSGNINHGYSTDKGPYEHPEVQRTVLELQTQGQDTNGATMNAKF